MERVSIGLLPRARTYHSRYVGSAAGVIFCLALILVFASPALALDHRVLDLDALLGHEEIRQIAFDETGRAYFLTGFRDPAALLPRDVCTDRRYRLHSYDELSDSITTVFSDLPPTYGILFDRDHRLWALQDGAVFRYTGCVPRMVMQMDPQKTRRHVRDMALGRDGCVWLAGEWCLFRIDTALVVTDFTDRIPTTPDSLLGRITDTFLGPLHVATNGDVWVGVGQQAHRPRAFALQIRDGEWVFHRLVSSTAEIAGVLSITSTADGRVWVSVETFLGPGRILCFAHGGWSEIEIPLLHDAPVDQPKSQPNMTRVRTLVAEDNRLWAVLDPANGLPVARLMTYDPVDSAWADSPYVARDACAEVVSGGSREGQMWVAEFPCGYRSYGRLHRIGLDR
jgi:hypothetical protein